MVNVSFRHGLVKNSGYSVKRRFSVDIDPAEAPACPIGDVHRMQFDLAQPLCGIGPEPARASVFQTKLKADLSHDRPMPVKRRQQE